MVGKAHKGEPRKIMLKLKFDYTSEKKEAQNKTGVATLEYGTLSLDRAPYDHHA